MLGRAPTLVRHLAGDHCADLLGLPPANWTAPLLLAWMKRLTHAERTHKAAAFRVLEALRAELDA